MRRSGPHVLAAADMSSRTAIGGRRVAPGFPRRSPVLRGPAMAGASGIPAEISGCPWGQLARERGGGGHEDAQARSRRRGRRGGWAARASGKRSSTESPASGRPGRGRRCRVWAMVWSRAWRSAGTWVLASPASTWLEQLDRLLEPTRHGHALAARLVAEEAGDVQRQRPACRCRAATTTTAPEPSIEPASPGLEVERRVGRAGGEEADDAPPGANGRERRPPVHAAGGSISSRDGRAHRHLVDAGPFDVRRETTMNFRPWRRAACARHQSRAAVRMAGTPGSVSTLLITVGWPNRPCVPGNGGLLRGSPRRSSIASSSAVSSPQDVAAGADEDLEVEAELARRRSVPRASRSRAPSPRRSASYSWRM